MTPYSIITETILLNLPTYSVGACNIIDASSQLQILQSQPLRNTRGNKNTIFHGKLNIQIIYEEQNAESSVKVYKSHIPVIALLPQITNTHMPLQAKVEHFSSELINSHTIAISFILVITSTIELDEPNIRHSPKNELSTVDRNFELDTEKEEITVNPSIIDKFDPNLISETNVENTNQMNDDFDIYGLAEKNTIEKVTTNSVIDDLDLNPIIEETIEHINKLDGDKNAREVDSQHTTKIKISPSYSYEPEISPRINLKRSLNDPDRVYLTSNLFSIRKRKKGKFKQSKKMMTQDVSNSISNHLDLIDTNDYVIPTEYFIQDENKRSNKTLEHILQISSNQIRTNEQEMKIDLEKDNLILEEIAEREKLLSSEKVSQPPPVVPYKPLLNLKDNKTTLSFINLSKNIERK